MHPTNNDSQNLKLMNNKNMTDHFYYFILWHILQLNGVAIATKIISWGNCLNIQIGYGWCSYCSSFCNFENWCIQDTVWLHYTTRSQLRRYICPDYYLGTVSSVVWLHLGWFSFLKGYPHLSKMMSKKCKSMYDI